MATVKKAYKKEGQKVIVHCDVPNTDGFNCMECAHCVVREPWCDAKCYFPNHVVNNLMPGLVCEDFLVRKGVKPNVGEANV